MFFYLLIGGVIIYIAVFYGVKHGMESTKSKEIRATYVPDEEIEKEFEKD